MGKNQGHKARQQMRHVSKGGGGGSYNDGEGPTSTGRDADGMKDASFHTAEWHAARIAALTAERVPWEEWRAKQKAEQAREAAIADEEERRQKEYRAQLDADRARLLARGRNHKDLADKLKKTKKRKRKSKDKDKGKDKDKKRKRSKDKKDKKKRKKAKRDRGSSGSGSSSGSDSDSDSGSSSDSSSSSSGRSEGGGKDEAEPMRLSEWLKS